MTIRPARLSDFDHLETFVWQAIFPAFDVDGLQPLQRAENDALVETARPVAIEAVNDKYFGVFVAIDPKLRSLAGYIIADARPRAYAEIKQLIVKRSFHGKGVGELLLEEATEFIGRDRAVSLSVRHYNARAIAFFAKHGFENTGETAGEHAIPRSLMLREAFAAPVVKISPAAEEDTFGQDFPSADDEPVFEELPDYNLTTDESPLFETGVNALSTEDAPAEEPEETYLTDDQLTVLEAFIAKARAKKAGGNVAPANLASVASRPKNGMADSKSAEFDRSKIAFEIDYGEGQLERTSTSVTKEQISEAAGPELKPSFSFDFSPVEEDTSPKQEHVVAPVSVSVVAPVAEVAGIMESSDFSPQEGKLKLKPEVPVEEHTAPERIASGDVARRAESAKTKDCPDCATQLPSAARFCFVCGMPQSTSSQLTHNDKEKGAPFTIGQKAVPPTSDLKEEEFQLTELPPLEEDALSDIFAALPDEPLVDSDAGGSSAPAEGPTSTNSVNEQSAEAAGPENDMTPPEQTAAQPVSIVDLRKAFQRHLRDRILAYFGERKLKKYLDRMENDPAFLQVRDGSLNSLAQWLSGGPVPDLARARRQNTFADLTEYFIVETAGDLSNHILPQRLLRHQSADWQTADFFKLVMDYLNFEAEADVVHTDFVTMPARALKNATKSFLHAAKDERVFFICDQSLISQARNGFAVTDSGIYWKNVLQPAGAATFTTMRETRLESGHLIIDGQFFDAGGRLNLKVAVLLDKLRRMQ